MPAPVSGWQRHGVDHICDAIFIENIDDLEKPIANAPPHDAPLPITTRLGIRPPCALDNAFSLRRSYAMAGDVIDVPGVPPEFHDLII